MSPESIDDQDYVLAMLLRQTSDAMVRARQLELVEVRVTTIEAATLLAIDNLGERATPAGIARWVLRRPNSMSALLKRMEKDGLVVRARDLERKNLVRMALTDYGRETLQKVSVRTSIHAVFGALSGEERRALRDVLLHVRAVALGLLHEKPPPLPLADSLES